MVQEVAFQHPLCAAQSSQWEAAEVKVALRQHFSEAVASLAEDLKHVEEAVDVLTILYEGYCEASRKAEALQQELQQSQGSYSRAHISCARQAVGALAGYFGHPSKECPVSNALSFI